MDDAALVRWLVFVPMLVIGLFHTVRALYELAVRARIMAGDEVPGKVISAKSERGQRRRAGSRQRSTVFRRREVVDFRTRDGRRVQGRPWRYEGGGVDANGNRASRQGQQVWVIHARRNPQKFVAPLRRGMFPASAQRLRLFVGLALAALGGLAIVYQDAIFGWLGA